MMEFLNSEAILNIIAAAVALGFGLIKRMEWMQRAKNERYLTAMQAIAAGVDQSYTEYVKEIKEGQADGKLTSDEIVKARRKALNFARNFARKEGVDLVTELGASFLESILTRAVQQAKKLSTKKVG